MCQIVTLGDEISPFTSLSQIVYTFDKYIDKGDSFMNNLQIHLNNYLEYCAQQKRLDSKTLKAYQIDLNQFIMYSSSDLNDITPACLECYISKLHQQFKPKTVKRKITSLKAFMHYLEFKDIIEKNPFNKVHIKFRESIVLPRIIPLHTIEILLSTVYQQRLVAHTDYQKKNTLRDVAILELLFATGIRISELCTLKDIDINLYEGTVLIYGKGSKERMLQIGNEDIIILLKEYRSLFLTDIQKKNYFFATSNGNPISDQSVRRMIKKYCSIANIRLHITPHMFRHTFATSLLDADVDIRYIQEMLGHSSINVTQIYTHVSTSKQKLILTTKHPRNNFQL